RNGTQLECINCACCIDACYEVMNRVGYKPGLIRYASEKMIAERKLWHFTWRSGAYTLLLTILLSTFFYFLITKHPVEATVLRSPGMLFQDQGEGKISNLYDIKIVNKTSKDLPVEIKLISPEGKIELIGNSPVIKNQTVGEMAFFVILDRKLLSGEKTKLKIGVFSNGKELDNTTATFLGPKK
ncbi:MAG: FixG Ig-like domain-containing protein, partial [Bacteroidota bacterium]